MGPLVILTILDKITGAITVVPAVLNAAVRLKELLSVDGSDFEVQLQKIETDSVKAADETLQIVADWKASHPE